METLDCFLVLVLKPAACWRRAKLIWRRHLSFQGSGWHCRAEPFHRNHLSGRVLNDMLWSDSWQFCHLLLKIHQHVQVKVLCCHLKIFWVISIETDWNWFLAPDLAWNRSSGRLDWAPYLKFSGWWEIQAGKVKPRILAADPQNYNAVKLWYLHLYPLFP